MAQQDDLFELIQSLTPSEKRYFKLHADSYSYGGYKKQYEKLYDALNNWTDEVYDEKEFRRKNKGKTFLKNLPADKAYLRDLILKVMRNYNSDLDPQVQVAEMLMNIRILSGKGLKAQAFKMIEKAMKLAEQTEQYNEILSINDYLLSLHKISPSDSPYDAVQVEKMDQSILEKIRIMRQAMHIHVYMAEIEVLSLWKQKEKEVKNIMEQVAILEAGGNLSRRAELMLLNTKQYYSMHLHQYEQYLDITSPWLDKIEKASNSYEYTVDQYRFILANYMFCALHSGKLELIPPAIAKLKLIKSTTEQAAADCFRVILAYELAYLINTRNFDRAEAMLPYLQEGLEKHKRFITEQRTVAFINSIVVLFFLQKKYKDCLDHIVRLYYITGRNESYDYNTTLARTMEWMCQYSLGSTDILDASLRNLKRYYSDRRLKNDFFDAMFEFFNYVLKSGNKKSPALEMIKKRLSDHNPDPQWEQIKGLVMEWI